MSELFLKITDDMPIARLDVDGVPDDCKFTLVFDTPDVDSNAVITVGVVEYSRAHNFRLKFSRELTEDEFKKITCTAITELGKVIV